MQRPTLTIHLAIWGLVLGAAAVGWAFAGRSVEPVEPAADTDSEPIASPEDEPTWTPPSLAPAPPDLRWLAAASGGIPELNQVSIEQDLGLVREVLGPGGWVLFGAGPHAPVVQELAPDLHPDPVAGPLGALFAPRGGRDTRYRVPAIDVQGPGTLEALEDALAHARRDDGPPLLVYLAGHGVPGETARDDAIELWGQGQLSVGDMAELLASSPRRVRLVMTTCYGGGFADIVFAAADPAAGPAATVHCGLFATTWDLEASGCDPNPDRAAQEGYGLHFLHALRGEDRDGHALDATVLDLDGDGSISALEAHARVRLASEAADVPTTTSERWLEHVVPTPDGQRLRGLWPEEEAVIAGLADRLGLRGHEDDARDRLDTLETRIEAAAVELGDAQADEEQAYRRAAADVLARWPVLDDPWHPRFAATVTEHRDAIARHLEHAPSYAQWLDAKASVDRLAATVADLRRAAAPFERLVRALDNRERAARLRAMGGASWERYEALLACERDLVQ